MLPNINILSAAVNSGHDLARLPHLSCRTKIDRSWAPQTCALSAGRRPSPTRVSTACTTACRYRMQADHCSTSRATTACTSTSTPHAGMALPPMQAMLGQPARPTCRICISRCTVPPPSSLLAVPRSESGASSFALRWRPAICSAYAILTLHHIALRCTAHPTRRYVHI